MDRRTVLAVVLSVTIYYTWLAIRGVPAPPELEPMPEPAPAQVVPAPQTPEPTDAPVKLLDFAACQVEAKISTDGGGLHNAVLVGAEGPLLITPIYSWAMGLFSGGSSEWHPYGQAAELEILLGEEAHAMVAGSGNPADSTRRFEVVSSNAEGIALRSVGADGVTVDQFFTAAKGNGNCTFDVAITWTNAGSDPVASGDLWVGLFDRLPPAGGMLSAYTNSQKAFARVDDDLWYGEWSEPEEGAIHVPDPLDGETADWIALADRYFGFFAMPEDHTGRVAWATYGPWHPEDGVLQGAIWSPAQALAPGESHESRFVIYAGAHDTDVLAEIDESLVDIVDFGMFAVFAWPLLFALRFLHDLLGNWGLAIIALTVGVKVAFFPLMHASLKSGEKMKAIQPLMNEIRETYKDDAEEMNRRTMELFREHKVNPLGGCLPMVIQMPVFLALFYVLMYSADLYHTDFLYLQDLSSPDPYCVLPAVVVGLMVVQQQFMPTGNMDPAQARMMKMMPLMFGFFWFMFPSGLVVYYFINTVLSILQQWWIRRTFATAGAPVPEA